MTYLVHIEQFSRNLILRGENFRRQHKSFVVCTFFFNFRSNEGKKCLEAVQLRKKIKQPQS